MADYGYQNNGFGNGSQNDNNNEKNRVSSSGIVLFDQESMMLRCAYLGDSLALTLAEPVKTDSGKNSYPESSRQSVLVTVDRAVSFYNMIIRDVLPAIEAGEDYCGGIFLNRNKTKILQVRIQEKEIYLVFCMNINSERVSENCYVFHFQKNDIITGYDPSSGNLDTQTTIEGAFYVFMKYLECGIGGIVGGAGHSVRKSNQYTTDSIFTYLKTIAAKLGVTVQSNTYTRNTTYQPNPGFMHIPEGAGEELPFSDENASTIDSILS